MATDSECHFLTIDQLARRLGVSAQTVRRRVHDGELPAPIRLGGLVRWRVRDVEVWERRLAKHAETEGDDYHGGSGDG